MKRFAWCVFIAMMFWLLVGCAGDLKYTRPASKPTLSNSVLVKKSKDEVWKEIVPALGRKFFVINNLDKDSGIINISYSGDPEKYVDCGRIYSYVKNLRGERVYDFPASKGYAEYEVMEKSGLYGVKRQMNLEGRMNIILEEIGPRQTQVTVNTKYVLTRTSSSWDTARDRTNSYSDTVSFNSGQQGVFPDRAKGKGCVECQANGQFEKEVLSVLIGAQ